MMDKPQIFNPNAIQEINFTPGRHNAYPTGNVVKPQENEVLLLHSIKLWALTMLIPVIQL